MNNRLLKTLVTSAIVLFLTSTLWASAVITNFHGEPGKNKVVLKWTSLSEKNCKEFVVERSLDRQSYTKVGTVKAAGSSSDRKDYEFQDKTVFRPTGGNTFYYRLRIVDMNGSNQALTEVVTVKPTISGVRHTWGSLKAMFR